MVGYLDGSTTVLTAIPTPPPNFRNVSDPLSPGTYLIGHTHMTAEDIQITSFLQRVVGSSDDVILGILTVFLIGVLSEIVSSIFLRTRNAAPSNTAIRAVYTLDQFSRFRNIRTALVPGRRLATLFVLSVALALFAAEVVTVVLTQPSNTDSSAYQYNLVASQPVATTRGRATFIRRIAGDRICVTPLITDAKQRRNFAIAACIQSRSKLPSSEFADTADIVKVSSWYHKGGSNHNVTFGDGWYSVSVRAYLYTDASGGGGRHILFNTTKDPAHAFYVQELFMYASMEWACNDGRNRPKPTKTCEELVNRYRPLDQKADPKDVILWRGKTDFITDRVEGLISTFQVSLPLPYRAVNSGVRAFFTSSAMYEVEGPAAYTRLTGDEEEDGIAGLITEEGRIAGVWAMSMIFFSFAVVMVILRVRLRPTTLGEMAFHRNEEDKVFDQFEEEEREIVRRRQTQHVREGGGFDEDFSVVCSELSASFDLGADDDYLAERRRIV